MADTILDPAKLYQNFKSASPEARPSLVTEALLESRDSFRHIIQAGATRSLDEMAFFEGVSAALARDAENLPALRLLAWHHIRCGAWDAAKATLRRLIAAWPNVPDTRRELARVAMLAPGPDAPEIFTMAVPELRTALAQASYGCQFALARGDEVPEALSRSLHMQIIQFREEILRDAADPVVPAASRGVFLEVLRKILAADSIALVANGPSLTGTKAGAEIDAHTLVIRCNFPELAKFSEDVGKKTDIVFFSEALVNGLPGLQARDPAYAECLALAFHPEPEAVFPPEVYARQMGPKISRISPKFREFIRGFFYTRPTTGLMGIVLVAAVLGKQLKIYGFDFYSQPVTHYFPYSAPVFLGHELQYERWFLECFLVWAELGTVIPGFAPPVEVGSADPLVGMRRPGEIENGVLVGSQGQLFLASGGHSVSAFVTGERQVEAVNFEIFRENLQSRAAWANAHGAQYVHVIMPDKQSIMPQAWSLGVPIRLGALYAGRNADLADFLLYPVALLGARPEKTIKRTDTHLTTYGSLLVTKMLVEKFTGEPQDAFFEELAAQIDREMVVAGDLGSKLEPPVVETLMQFRREPPGHCLHNEYDGGSNGGVDLRFNPQAPYRQRVLVFGDSFGRGISRDLQFWFAEVMYFRTGFFHEEIAAQCGPDIIITENVERYLDRCTPDDARPQFLLYPYLNEKPYAPSKAFATALSAVLSFPRKPYVDFMTAMNLAPRVPPAVVASAVPAARVHPGLRYGGLDLRDPPETAGLLEMLEAPRFLQRQPPEFVADFSGRGLALNFGSEQQHVHGSYLVRRQEALLFGPNHLVTQEGYWSCETRLHKRQFFDYMRAEFYDRMYPGSKPGVDNTVTPPRLTTAQMRAEDFNLVETPVFLATPLEPPIWGRWIATVAPKAAQFKKYGAGTKFFCHIEHQWQRDFLQLLGVDETMLLQHDAGKTHICRDVMTVEYSVTNMTISAWERMNFFEMVASHHVKTATARKIYVARLRRSRENPGYRVLQNEEELAHMLGALGFRIVEPEYLSFAQQMAVFAAAEQVVFLGGSALFNAVFCAPGTSVITIESSDRYVPYHAEMLSSLDMRYGVIFGEEDMTDASPWHRRWNVDVARVRDEVVRFFGAG